MSRESRQLAWLTRQVRAEREKLRQKEHRQVRELADQNRQLQAAKRSATFLLLRDVLADAGSAFVATLAVTFFIASLSAAGLITMPLALTLLALAWIAGIVLSVIFPLKLTFRQHLIFGALYALMLFCVGYYEAKNYEKPVTLTDLKELLAGASSHHYSSKQTIRMLPSYLGGNDSLNLDNAGTLKLAPGPEIALIQDVVPLKFPDKKTSKFEIADMQIYVNPPDQKRYVFDINDRKQHEIHAGSRTFIVTLLEVRDFDPKEYEFGISEK
jgi:hypothetical protein